MGSGASGGARLKQVAGLLIVLGLGLAAPGGWKASGFVFRLVTAPTHEVPGSFHEDLDGGTYLIALQTGVSTGVGPVSTEWSELVQVNGLQIIRPEGTPLSAQPNTTQSIMRKSTTYTGVATFEVTASGRHDFEVATSRPTTAIITYSFGRRGVWLAVGAFALEAFLLTGGLILLAIVLLRRRRARQLPPGTPTSDWL
ncbi:MAG: hypothetical protein P8N02_01180 [Actinomycetota bacterium]|nr:hypothetical protein [Actinomycetota bacterium]